MSWNGNKDRCQKIYFGKPEDIEPTKEEVGQFIIDKMGLEYDGGPAWSEGVPKLIRMGMRYRDKNHTEWDLKAIDDLEAEIEELRDENSRIRKQLAGEMKMTDPDLAIDRLEQTEALILSILCEEGSRGVDSPNFVRLSTIVRISGFDRSTVEQTLENLTRQEFGGYVDYDNNEGVARATRSSAFDEYCCRSGLDKDSGAAGS